MPFSTLASPAPAAGVVFSSSRISFDLALTTVMTLVALSAPASKTTGSNSSAGLPAECTTSFTAFWGGSSAAESVTSTETSVAAAPRPTATAR